MAYKNGVENMQRIALIMKRKPVVKSIMDRLAEESDTHVEFGFNYEEAVSVAINMDATVVLVEVAESGYYTVEYCLMLCDLIRNQKSSCKVLLLCPEQDGESVKQSISAKANGRIDDFAFYETSTDYLIAKLISLQ